MNFVDIENLGGSFDLAAAQVGMQMKHRVALPGGFGNEAVEANRHLLPGGWGTETGTWEEWTPQRDIAFASATPPCSGWSLLNSSKGANARGMDSNINDCTKAAVRYAATCHGSDGQPGPEIIAFESVQQAFKLGRELMQSLRDGLNERTGQRYTLTHLLMSGASVGSAQYRKRYFFIAHRVPFGIESPIIDRVRTVRDAIGDLTGLENKWPLQYIRNEGDARYRRVDDFVDSHTWNTEGTAARVLDIAGRVEWPSGVNLPDVVKRHYTEESERPNTWSDKAWTGIFDPKRMHINAVTRLYYDRPGYVITGAGGSLFIHPEEPRFLSVREAYRLMGFPDDWTITWAKNVGHANVVCGKQIPVESTRWLCGWVKRALEGDPGAWHGEKIGDDEFKINCTSDYLRVFHGRTFEHGVDGRNKKLIEEMESRPA